MAQTSYNTLTLSEEEPRKARSSAVYVVLGLAVVAMAGAAAVFASGAVHTQTAVNAEFSATDGSVAMCDASNDAFLVNLPKYDPELNKADADRSSFYNACYYAFRCCTTTKASCMKSDNFGEICTGCLRENAPRMVRPWCLDYAQQQEKGKGGEDSFAEELNAPKFSLLDLKAPTFDENGNVATEKMPEPIGAVYSLKLKNAGGVGKKTCWPQPGEEDIRVKTFAEQCFEVISWCNLLCPRDGQNSNQHAMCKHCMVTEFALDDSSIDVIKTEAVESAAKQKTNEENAETAIVNEFTSRYV